MLVAHCFPRRNFHPENLRVDPLPDLPAKLEDIGGKANRAERPKTRTQPGAAPKRAQLAVNLLGVRQILRRLMLGEEELLAGVAAAHARDGGRPATRGVLGDLRNALLYDRLESVSNRAARERESSYSYGRSSDLAEANTRHEQRRRMGAGRPPRLLPK